MSTAIDLRASLLARLDRAIAICEAATPIDGAPGYRVDRDGRVFSEQNWRGYGPRQLKPQKNSHGYHRVRLTIHGKSEGRLVHRVVAAAFLPPRPSPQHEIRHLNGDKLDNRAENLAWGTRRENAEDRERHGRTARGDRNGSRTKPDRLARRERNYMYEHPERCANARLTPVAVREIRLALSAGDSKWTLARRFGVAYHTIYAVEAGISWKGVGDLAAALEEK